LPEAKAGSDVLRSATRTQISIGENEMKKFLIPIVLCLGCLCACSESSVLSEVAGYISKFSPLLGIAEGATCIIAAPACAAVTAFVNTAEPFAAQTSSAFQAWSNASEQQQPGLLSAVITSLQTWQSQLQNGLQLPAVSTQTQAMIQAELGMTADALQIFEQTQANGGTTSALSKVLNEATPIYETEPTFASWNPLAVVRKPAKLKLKNGAEVRTWASYRSAILLACSLKSGNKNWDAQYAKLTEQIKDLK
jgi:hypothetical protein